MRRWWIVFALGFVACAAPQGGPPPAPQIVSVTPRVANAGQIVTVRGAGFEPGSGLRVAGLSLVPEVLGADRLRFTLPALPVGEYTLTVTNPGGASATHAGPAVLGDDGEDVIRGSVYVTFAADTSAAVAQQLARDTGFTLETFNPPAAELGGACGKASAVYVDTRGRSTAQAINDLDVALEGLNPAFEADPRSALTGSQSRSQAVPSPRADETNLRSGEQPRNLRDLSLRDLNTVRVAVVDTGVSAHPLLADLEPGRNFTSADNPDDPRPVQDDVSDQALYDGAVLGHGTGVAALIAGRFPPTPPTVVADRANAQFRRGGALGVRLLPVKVCTPVGGRNLCIGSDVVQGICYAIAQRADVINLSLGGRQPMRALKNVLQQAAQQGISIVTSAGNRGLETPQPTHYPAAYAPEIPGLIAVGAARDAAGVALRAPFSSRGAWVSVAAYADPVRTAAVTGLEADFAGTSFAAPQVSAVVALLRAQHPEWPPAQLRARIEASASPTPQCPPDACGAGLLDETAALRTP